MKIYFSKYQLQPVESSLRSSRSGALLQVVHSDEAVGYGDCHPWPELDDFPLDMQLQLLSYGHITPLMNRTLAAARLDADARKSSRNLFNDLQIPSSHLHMSDLLSRHHLDFEKFLEQSPCTIKIKTGFDPQTECMILNKWRGPLLNSGCRLRLDFNCRLSEDGFNDYLKELGDLRELIEFYEDPFLYQPQLWQKVREDQQVALACDRDSSNALLHPDSCDVLVIKPAVQEIHPFLHTRRANRSLVITSYLDHPIGQLAAAYVAADLSHQIKNELSLCGLLTHQSYNQTPFSASFSLNGTRLIPSTDGTGWGFDLLLQEQIWQPLL